MNHVRYIDTVRGCSYAVRMVGTFAGSDTVAEWLGISQATLVKWRERYSDFPEPDVVITSGKGDIPGWAPTRQNEITAWPDTTTSRRGAGWRKGITKKQS